MNRFFFIVYCSFLLTLLISGSSENSSIQETNPFASKAIRFLDAGLYDSALLNYRKAEEIYEQSEDVITKASCKNSIADIYRLLADNENALNYIDQVVKLCEKQLPGNTETLAKANEIAGKVFDYNIRDFKKAREHYEKALTIRKELFGLEHPATAETYFLIGRIHLNTGKFNEAKVYFDKSEALKIKLEGEGTLSLYDLYLSEAVLNRRVLKFEDALNYYQKAEYVWKKNNKPESHPSFGLLAYGMGNLYIEIGHYDDAIQQYKQALTNFLICYGENDYHISTTYSNIGAAYSNQLDFTEALDYYTKALVIYQATMESDHPFISSLYVDFCDLYSNAGNYEKSIFYGKKSIELLEKRYANQPNRDLGIACFYTGNSLLLAGKFQEALPVLNKGISIFKTMDEKYLLSNAYATRGALYDALQENILAEKDFLEAINVYGKNPRNLHLAYVYRAYATYTSRLKKFDEALLLTNKGLHQLGITFSNPYTLPSLDSLYTVDFLTELLPVRGGALLGLYKTNHDKKALQAALKNYEALTKMYQRVIQESKQERSKLLQLPSLAGYYEKAVECALELFELTKDEQFKNKAFAFAEQSKAILLWHYVHDTQTKQFSGIPQEVVLLERRLKETINYYEKRLAELATAHGDSVFASLQEMRFKTKIKYDSLVGKLENDYPSYYSLKYQGPSGDVKEQMRTLSEKEAILEYLIGNESIYLFFIANEEFEIITIPNDSSVANDADGLRKAVAEKNMSDYTGHSLALYKKIFQPVETLLKKKQISTITVVPDGFINYIPFEALLKEMPSKDDPAEFSYLLNEYTFHYQFSSSLISVYHSIKNNESSHDFLGFAPSFEQGSVSSGKIGNLSYTKEEVDYIATELNGDTFIGNNATESNFKRLSNKYRIIHLATHAIMDDENADLSRLYFSETADSLEDDKLYAYELFSMEIPAQLVTLSACNTGTGNFHKGEGVMSLSRAFAYAGCPSIVTSLWPAQDKSTATLMKYFYDNLADGLGKNESLRQAKLKYIKESDKIKSQPFFWAGFMLMGDERPIEKGNKFWMYALIGIVVVAGGALLYRKVNA